MRRMKKVRKSKSGVTLLGMMLVSAILVILVSFVFATFTIINTSHAQVAVINDAKDFADLNMRALSKLVVNADRVALTNSSALTSTDLGNKLSTSVYFDTGTSELHYTNGSGDHVAVAYPQYTINNGAEKKWSVSPTFTASGQAVTVRLDVYDNSSDEIYYTLTKTIFVPNLISISGSSGSVLKFGKPTF